MIDLEHFDLKENHVYTEFVGLLMFGVYCCISIVVLLNMLIAMMSNSYQSIAVSKYARWKLTGKSSRSRPLSCMAVILVRGFSDVV